MTRERLMELGVSGEIAKQLAEEMEAERNAMLLEHAVDVMLLREGAVLLPAVKAMLDMKQVGLDEEGALTGLKEQIEALKQDAEAAVLFRKQSACPEVKLKGVELGADMDRDEDCLPERMGYDALCAYLAEHPGVKL